MTFHPDHLALVTQAQHVVAKWAPRMPWLAGWKLTTEPINSPEGEDWTIQITVFHFLREAAIEIKQTAGNDPRRSLEEGVIHELCHVLFSTAKYNFYSLAEATLDRAGQRVAAGQWTVAEEIAIWALTDCLVALDRVPADELTLARFLHGIDQRQMMRGVELGEVLSPS